jgi:hypothetical protein
LVLLLVHHLRISLPSLADLMVWLLLKVIVPEFSLFRNLFRLHFLREISAPDQIWLAADIFKAYSFVQATTLPQGRPRFAPPRVRNPVFVEEGEDFNSGIEQVHLKEDID